MRALDARLDNRGADNAIVVVAGAAGIGKTALAVQWAHRIRDRFPDGQLFLDLRGHDPETALAGTEVLAHALRGLGVPEDRLPVAIADRLRLYRSLVDGRRLLVVLDNAGTADQVLPLALTGATAFLVVTSRHRLAGVVVHHAVHLVELDVLSHDEARTLLGRVLGADRLARESAAVAGLIELCDRIPLALRVAAAVLSARPRRSIAELVDDLGEDDRLDALSVYGGSQSVRSVPAGTGSMI